MAGVAGSNPVAPTFINNKYYKLMDSTFIPVTITFFTFIIIAYYLNVIRLSIPIVMIYFIYCFSYFINDEKIKPENDEKTYKIEMVKMH